MDHHTEIIDRPPIDKSALSFARAITKEAKDVLGDKFIKSILFGSYARGDFDEYSDVDIMILADIPHTDVSDYIDKLISRDSITYIELAYEKVSQICMQSFEFFNYWKEALPFYQNVEQEGFTIND